jgi:hypothetical protein
MHKKVMRMSKPAEKKEVLEEILRTNKGIDWQLVERARALKKNSRRGNAPVPSTNYTLDLPFSKQILHY